MTAPIDVIRLMFEHHLWATDGMIDHLAGLPEERLDASVPGTYGSMIMTLTHLVEADERYLQRFDDPSLPPQEDWTPLPLEMLRERMQDHRRRWSEKLDALERGELHAGLKGRPGFQDTDEAEGLLMLQAVHHGNDHRTQICSTLGSLGDDVPDLDGWSHWAATRG